MGRSVDYLSRALRVNYFPFPEEEEEEDWQFLVEDIQECIRSEYPAFSPCKKWDGNEVRILLQGYGLEIGLSEYGGMCSLSIRLCEDLLPYDWDEQEREEAEREAQTWVDLNWHHASRFWNQLRKIGTFSNGESIYESKK